MPLHDVKCDAGHISEVFRRGAETPLVCAECGAAARVIPSAFTAVIAPVTYAEPPQKLPKRRPQYISRAGGGVAAKTENNTYRPALTHTATCPNEKRRRNVAVLGDLPYGKRLNCEACGYQWIHQENTAADPLLPGVDVALKPGKPIITGNKYTQPDRGA